MSASLNFRWIVNCVGVLTLLFALPLSAQHSDIFVYQSDGVLVPTNNVSEQRVFSRLFDFFGHPFGNTSQPKLFVGNDPGFQSTSTPISGTSVLPTGSILAGDFLPFGVPNGATGNLLHWDPTVGDVDFQDVTAGHTFEVTDSAGNSGFLLDGSNTLIENTLIGLVSSSNVIHEHIEWRLDDGDGNSDTDPNRGVYLMLLRLTTDGLEDSEPIAVLLNSTDISVTQQNQATAWVENNLDSFVILGESQPGDIDGNGAFDLADIDQVVAAVASSNSDLQFDVNGDGIVSYDDVTSWLAIAGEANLPSMAPYLVGDANLDGVVDASDFNVWNGWKLTSNAAWSRADFNADGSVDISDFNIWNSNKFLASDAPAAVPEPAGATWIVLLSLVVCLHRRHAN